MRNDEFLRTLFDSGESVCLTNDVFGTVVMPLNEALAVASQYQYFSINPLQNVRKDGNCTAYRNFLIEFDTISLKEQARLILESGLPYTSIVFSGKKSYHVVISLVDPLKDRHEYNRIARWIHAVLPLADKSCKNPSRLSRMAGAIRSDTGMLQELQGSVMDRIDISWIMSWLKRSGVSEPANLRVVPFHGFRPIKTPLGLIRRTIQFLDYGASVGSRTHELFAATCNLYRNGYNADEITAMAKKRLDFVEFPHYFRTIRCAIEDCESQKSIK